MVEERKYCSDVMKKHFNKELVMTKKDKEDFENLTKKRICDNFYVDGDVKVRGHCHINKKFRGSVHRNCNIKVKLNQNIPVVFHNLKKYNSYLIMQELGKFNLILNFKIQMDSFKLLSSSLGSLVFNIGKDDFKYLIQEFFNKVIDLVNQKGFYHYEYMSGF